MIEIMEIFCVLFWVVILAVAVGIDWLRNDMRKLRKSLDDAHMNFLDYLLYEPSAEQFNELIKLLQDAKHQMLIEKNYAAALSAMNAATNLVVKMKEG
jgi:Mg2+/Co2+ transporter CorC